ncbi:MAG TPA: hypothetical protein VLQ80_29055 [Candidatus Saccharimonadia bacterium]|nr:hypothetical protein [Candidatus Saccharimonadia bacterium]
MRRRSAPRRGRRPSADIGTLLGITAFAVAILGDITQTWGVMLAGLGYGIIEALMTALLGCASTHIVTFIA